MDWLRIFSRDLWQSQQIDKLESKVRYLHSARASGVRTANQVEQLEDDLSRALLLLHALVKVCVDKGVLTADELSAAIDKMDLADGRADGKLDPAATRPTTDEPQSSHRTPEQFLHDLEQRKGTPPDRSPKSRGDSER